MRITDETQAWIIKISAVVTAMPRWVGALLAAEGLAIPENWVWWLPLSAVMSAGMAIVEGWAFAYVFSAWRNSSGRASRWMAALAILSAVVFVAVVAPYIAASVRDVTVGDMLSNNIALFVWSSSVALSTIAIVASVGFAQKRQTTSASKPSAEEKQNKQKQIPSYANCPWCHGELHEPFKTQNQRNAHVGRCKMKPQNGNGKTKEPVTIKEQPHEN